MISIMMGLDTVVLERRRAAREEEADGAIISSEGALLGAGSELLYY